VHPGPRDETVAAKLLGSNVVYRPLRDIRPPKIRACKLSFTA
jgi:hypothetical protein